MFRIDEILISKNRSSINHSVLLEREEKSSTMEVDQKIFIILIEQKVLRRKGVTKTTLSIQRKNVLKQKYSGEATVHFLNVIKAGCAL